MSFCSLIYQNLLNAPLLCFVVGIGIALFIKNEGPKPPRLSLRLPSAASKFLTIYILFCIGLKGGDSIIGQWDRRAQGSVFSLFSLLMLFGFIQPFFSFFLLKKFTKIDRITAAAIAASFGSVSVMTFAAAASFLEHLSVSYKELLVAALAIMEIPAIISGVLLARVEEKGSLQNFSALLRESLLNKALLSIGIGLILGTIFQYMGYGGLSHSFTSYFVPLLCLFLFDMGQYVGLQKKHFASFSFPLFSFGVYMPLLSGFLGLLISRMLTLDVGTGTLVAVLLASASYIAVPAAMRIALPQAKEAVYLPLSLGVAFPFNIIIGIPLYFHFSKCILG